MHDVTTLFDALVRGTPYVPLSDLYGLGSDVRQGLAQGLCQRWRVQGEGVVVILTPLGARRAGVVLSANGESWVKPDDRKVYTETRPPLGSREADPGRDLARITDPRPELGWICLGMSLIWPPRGPDDPGVWWRGRFLPTAPPTQPAPGSPCAVCCGRRLRRSEICTWCNRCGFDRELTPLSEAEQTKMRIAYRRDGHLQGGLLGPR